MKIITAGPRYLDIDAYAGCVAYAELLQKQGIAARAVSTAPLNESIPPQLRALKVTLDTTYSATSGDTFILVDVSDPSMFDTFVDEGKVEAVIDHHPGFEDYWRQRIGGKAQIEHVGAACTQVFEHWQAAGLANEMSKQTATLLCGGILNNTLNFGATVTTQRDREAYKALSKHAGLPEDWPAQYFAMCDTTVLQNFEDAVRNDTKQLRFQTFPEQVTFGQCAVWDAADILGREEQIKHILSGQGEYWFMNIICIKEGVSYFITDSPKLQQWISQLLEVAFLNARAVAKRMWLRKEVMKQDIIADGQL